MFLDANQNALGYGWHKAKNGNDTFPFFK